MYHIIYGNKIGEWNTKDFKSNSSVKRYIKNFKYVTVYDLSKQDNKCYSAYLEGEKICK